MQSVFASSSVFLVEDKEDDARCPFRVERGETLTKTIPRQANESLRLLARGCIIISVTVVHRGSHQPVCI